MVGNNSRPVQAQDHGVTVFGEHASFGVTANQKDRNGLNHAPAAAHFFGRHLGNLGKGPRNYRVQNTGKMARGSGNFARQLRSENKLWRVESLFQSGTFPPNITSAGRLPPGIPENSMKASLDAQRTLHRALLSWNFRGCSAALDAQRTFFASGVIFPTS